MNTRQKIAQLKFLKEEVAKKKALLARAKTLNEQVNGTNLFVLLENDLEQAKLILAARDVLDKLQKIAEHLAELGAEEIMPLADSMKGAFGPELAATFEHASNENIQKALETVRAAKDSINVAILQVEGKLGPQNDMMQDGSSGDNMGNDMTSTEGNDGTQMDDPFGGAPSNSGPDDEPLGRAKKESIQYSRNSLGEGKSYKYDDEEDDEEDMKDSRKKSKNMRDAGKNKRAEQKKAMSANESINLSRAGEKLLERVDMHSLMDWLLAESAKTMSGLAYTNFVRNATSKAFENPAAMAGWIGKKKFGESAMAELTGSTRNTRAELIAEAIANTIEKNISIFGRGRAAKVVEAYIDDSLMENEGNSILETFNSMYGMSPAEYSICTAKRIKEDDDDINPQDSTNATSAIGQIASKIASNPSLANQPTSSVMTGLDSTQQSALQKVAGVTAGDPSSPSNVGQMLKTANDKLNKGKPGMGVSTGVGEAAMQTDAFKHKANTNRPKLASNATTHPLKVKNKGKPLAQMGEAAMQTDTNKNKANTNKPKLTAGATTHPLQPGHKNTPLSSMTNNRGKFGQNQSSDMKGNGKVGALKGTNAKDSIAPNRDHMMQKARLKVAKESQTPYFDITSGIIEEAKVHRGDKGENTDKTKKEVGSVSKLKGTNAKDTIATKRKKITKEDLEMIGESKLHKHPKKHHKSKDYVAGVGAYYVGLPRVVIGGYNTGHFNSGYDAACDHDGGTPAAPSTGGASGGTSAGADTGGGASVSESKRFYVYESDDGEDMGPLEAHGVRGMKSTPWKKKFKSSAALDAWVEKSDGDIEVKGVRKLDTNESVVENINAANWPVDTMGQYKGTPMSTDYGKHKVVMTPSKADNKSSGPDASPKVKDTSRIPADPEGSKDSLVQTKAGNNFGGKKKLDTSKTNAKDTIIKNTKDKEKVPESSVYEDFSSSYEEEILEAAKKGKIPPQFKNTVKTKDAKKSKEDDKSPKPWADPKSKKAKASDKTKAIA